MEAGKEKMEEKGRKRGFMVDRRVQKATDSMELQPWWENREGSGGGLASESLNPQEYFLRSSRAKDHDPSEIWKFYFGKGRFNYRGKKRRVRRG